MFFFVIYQKYLDKSSINILKTKVMICDICSMTFRKATQVKDTFQYRHFMVQLLHTCMIANEFGNFK
jgi:hypothetical protein